VLAAGLWGALLEAVKKLVAQVGDLVKSKDENDCLADALAKYNDTMKKLEEIFPCGSMPTKER
jgi:hypothetical protein